MSKLKIGLCVVVIMGTLACGSTLIEEVETVPVIATPIVEKQPVVTPSPLPEVKEVIAAGPAIYNVPLDEELQRFTYEMCEEYGIREYYELMLAIMWKESTFCATTISETNDYGLMQINKCNHDGLREALGTTDFLDPEQNIRAGVYMMSKYLHKLSKSESLMAYNLGLSGAKRRWAAGTYTTEYSRNVLAKLELVLSNNYK